MKTVLFHNLQSKRKNAGKGEMLKVYATAFIGDVRGATQSDYEESIQALCEAFRSELEKRFKEVQSEDRD